MSGPAIGATCGVCNHSEIARIHQLVLEGRLSGTAIGRQFGLAKDQVSRHVYRGHPGVVVLKGGRWKQASTAVTVDPLGEDASEVDRLKTLREQLEKDMSGRPRSDTARELRQVHQRIAELEGSQQPKKVGVGDVRGLREQVARWFTALEPYPEARDAMLAVTDPALLPDEEE